jgi:hypothetical protein
MTEHSKVCFERSCRVKNANRFHRKYKKYWYKYTQDIACKQFLNKHIGNAKPAISLIKSKLFDLEKEKYNTLLYWDQYVRGNCGNKLKTYVYII